MIQDDHSIAASSWKALDDGIHEQAERYARMASGNLELRTEDREGSAKQYTEIYIIINTRLVCPHFNI